MTLSLRTFLPIHIPIQHNIHPLALRCLLLQSLLFLWHLITLGLLTTDLKNFEDITLIPAPMSNNATTSIPFACTLYRIGLESSFSASLTWISFTSFHSHSESECSTAWHNSLISSSVSCGTGESSLSKKASLMPIHLLSTNLQGLLTNLF